MSDAKTQGFPNHVKLVPAFHFFVLPVLLFNIIWSIVHTVRAFSAQAVVSVVLAVAFFVFAGTVRSMILRVQDRVIRLEMWLRMEQVLPVDLRGRVKDFTEGQLIALRFASDDELPELSRKVLAENLTDRKAIKKMIRNWQPDFLRA